MTDKLKQALQELPRIRSVIDNPPEENLVPLVLYNTVGEGRFYCIAYNDDCLMAYFSYDKDVIAEVQLVSCWWLFKPTVNSLIDIQEGWKTKTLAEVIKLKES